MENEVDHFYLSATEYSKQTGLGPEKVKYLCRTNQIDHYITENGYYKIKVFKNGSVSRLEYEKLLEEKTKLENKLNNILAILNN